MILIDTTKSDSDKVPDKSGYKDASPNKLDPKNLKFDQAFKESTNSLLTPLEDPNFFLKANGFFNSITYYNSSNCPSQAQAQNMIMTRNQTQKLLRKDT